MDQLSGRGPRWCPERRRLRRARLAERHGNANVKLAGPNVHVYTDINDSNAADAGEEVRSNQGRNFRYPFTMFPSTTTPCTGALPCSWAPDTANSWRTNRQQNGAQVFFFVNNFHDHLEAAPIGFTSAAGNFETIDPVQAEPLDGANGDVDGDGTIDGLPDGGHIDNANMNTPPTASRRACRCTCSTSRARPTR